MQKQSVLIFTKCRPTTISIINIIGLSGKPTISLNADQVIDLSFPDGNYFRSAGTHICEGRIGQYHSNLEIDITYDNGKSFQHIPKESIDLSRQNTSDGCSTNQTVIFGLRFSSEMDGARLRCRVSDRIDDFTLSEEFSLITSRYSIVIGSRFLQSLQLIIIVSD